VFKKKRDAREVTEGNSGAKTAKGKGRSFYAKTAERGATRASRIGAEGHAGSAYLTGKRVGGAQDVAGGGKRCGPAWSEAGG